VRETWPTAFTRAVRIVLWLSAMAVVVAQGALLFSEWRMNVAEFKANLDPRPRDMEEFPQVHEDVAKRVADAREGLAWVNKRFAVNGGLCGAIGAALMGGAVVHRRRRRLRGALFEEPRASWRTWVLAVPLAFVIVVLGLAFLGTLLRGTMTG
jgi:hypothetical protein